MANRDQKNAFLEGEADRWFARNAERLADFGDRRRCDEVVAALSGMDLKIGRIAEIGCADGWRLDMLRRRFGAACSGIDPSAEAVSSGRKRYPALDLQVATADRLPFASSAFDVVIFGFCLYLCDREDLFRIAAEADRVLTANGHIVIYDFIATFPYRNAYSHLPGLFSYKMDYAQMFLWNPAYRLIYQKLFSHGGVSDLTDIDNRLSVSVLGRNDAAAYPDNPY